MALITNGYSPLPIKPGEKRPAVSGWSRACANALSRCDLYRYAKSPLDYGLGVACGYGGLIAIDIDSDDPGVQKAVTAAIPGSRVGKRGLRGFTKFLQSVEPIKSAQIKAADGTVLVDVLASGRSCVLPPTPHPVTGRAYVWSDPEHTLFNKNVTDLPVIRADDIKAMLVALAPWRAKPRSNPAPRPARPAAPLSDIERRRYSALARASVDGAAADLGNMGKNTGRNHALFAVACRLGRYVQHGIISVEDLIDPLLAACTRNGLVGEDGPSAVIASINSGLARALNDPLPALFDRDRRGRA